LDDRRRDGGTNFILRINEKETGLTLHEHDDDDDDDDDDEDDVFFHIIIINVYSLLISRRSGFGGLEVIVLAFGTQVRGFKPGRSRRIFRAKKILSAPSFGGEVNLRHVKEPKINVEFATSGKILGNFSPIVLLSAAGFRLRRFRRWGLPVARVGTF